MLKAAACNIALFLISIPCLNAITPLKATCITGNGFIGQKNSYYGIVSGEHDHSVKTVPNSPTELMILDVSFDYVLLMWNDNSNNEIYFFIDRHLEGEAFTRYDTVESNETLYLDYTVEPSTNYSYRVCAANEDGISDYSNEISVTTLSLPHTPPKRPLNVSGYFNGTNAIILSWGDNSDNEVSFHIYRGTELGEMSLQDTVNSNITLFADYAISSNTTYNYYLTAWNLYGESMPSDTIQVEVTDITGINSPALDLLYVAYNSVKFRWNAIQGNGIQYILHRSSEGTNEIEFELHNSTEYEDSSLLPGTFYMFYLEANDLYGNQSFSPVIDVQTLPGYTQYRVSDSLISLYIFAQSRYDTIPDLSWYGKPVNLYITDTSFVTYPEKNYILFNQPNLLISSPEASMKLIEACKRSQELTIECWLKTSLANETDIPVRIISLGTDTSTAFSLNCRIESEIERKVNYYVNLTTNTTDQLGNPALASEIYSDPGVLHHIVFTHDRFGTESIFINGSKVAEGFRPPKFDTWTDLCYLTIANDMAGNEPWLGSLYMSALYNKALNEEEILRNYYASPFITEGYIINSSDYKVIVHPNPASDILYLQIIHDQAYTEITEEYRIKLINNFGNTELEMIVSEYMEGSVFAFDISSVKQGVYTLTLSNKHRLIYNRKIVIIR
jgi:hypothetical protein